MDLTLVYSVVVTIFALAALGLVLYFPYKIFQFCIRGMVKATAKTSQVISSALK
jgi:hypothetical protein